jgi:hypothetical protein
MEKLMPEKRGAKSTADLTVVPLLPGFGRPPPPEDMTKLEAEVWKSTVDSMPPRWFGTAQHELLRGYCAHCVMANQLLIRWRRNGYTEELGRQYDRETAAIIKLARQLRLVKLGRYERGNHHNKDEAEIRNASKKRLWET